MLRSIKQTCQPLPAIISGAFNAEIFTANLLQVVDDDRKGRQSTPYSDANLFFSSLTHPTSGMRQAVSRVARRLAGDASEGAITSLITGFGGGKTHTLIGMYHVATKGSEIAQAASPVIGDVSLPSPGSVPTAVLIGDIMDVTRSGPSHEKLPSTLWGEMARQIASSEIQADIAFQSDDVAAPGNSFLEKVIGDRPCLILVDEIAQYATRFEAAWPGRGASNVSAFLMTLFNYAKRTPGVSVVLTLAGQNDAFGGMLESLRKASGNEELDEEKARSIAGEADREVRSVVARDAASITPVTPAEIAAVLGRRLFSSIDGDAAAECADAYRVQRERQSIVSEVVKAERCRDLYPFHPTFIDLLTDKLSSVPTFQGTRGVLRTLALTVRAIWRGSADMPSIHACHVDLTDRAIVDELIGRTNQNNLQIALEKDVGGADAGRSIASVLDVKNPHPAGAPYHVLAWRTVFLHSLPGRGAGNRFGINDADAVVSCMMPQTETSAEISVSQITSALADIRDQAYYLRNEEGLCFADSQPSVNLILRQIEDGLPVDGIRSRLREIARKIVSNGIFTVVGDVTDADEVPDRGEPIVAIIDPYLNEILPDTVILETSRNKARIHQNVVHVLVPSCVRVPKGQEDYIDIQKGIEARHEAEASIRTRYAIGKLKEDHAEFGLTKAEVNKMLVDREKAVDIASLQKVASLYRTLFYPTADGVSSRLMSFSGQEGGRDAEKAILDALRANNEIVDEDNAKRMSAHLRSLVFSDDAMPTLQSIRDTFAKKRSWPLLQNDKALEIVIRENVASGHWAVFRFTSETLDRPDVFYDKSTPFPLAFEFTGSLKLIRYPEAVQKGWPKSSATSDEEIAKFVRKHIDQIKVGRVDEIAKAVAGQRGDVDEPTVQAVVLAMARKGDYRPDKGISPEAIGSENLIMTPAEYGRRHGATQRVLLEGTTVAGFLNSIGGIRRLPALFAKGGKSTVDRLYFIVAFKTDGRMTIDLENIAPATVATLDEYLETLETVGEIEPDGDAELIIEQPVDDCAVVAAIQSYRS